MIIAALVQALSAVMILISPTFIGTAIAAGVMGVGYGAYMAVSLALATDLLPRVKDHARDLGIVNAPPPSVSSSDRCSEPASWRSSADSGCSSSWPASSRSSARS
ncbi:hypothetical protein [Microbacterium profundi]